MKINDLFKKANIYSNVNTNDNITGIEFDSRKIKKGNLFIALKGFITDGHKYINQSFINGASYVLIDKDREGEVLNSIEKIYHKNIISVDNTRIAMAYLAKAFYNAPDKNMKIIGVTGTKGKTTTTFIIKSILECDNKKVGLIGTINNMIGNDIIESSNTTPESLDLFKLLKHMYDKNVEYVVMEISSHALILNRVNGLDIDIAIFTNFSQDHLDFHKTMDEYFSAKLLIFDLLKKSTKDKKLAIINRDIIEYEKIHNYIMKLELSFITYGLNKHSIILAHDYDYKSIDKTTMLIDFENSSDYHFETNLIGDYNIYNILCAISAMYHFKINFICMREGVKNIKVPGRLEKVLLNNGAIAVIDYAHTDKSLENVLITLKRLHHNRVITIFGCGGDRDKLKRPLMGEVAFKYSDYIIITSDNPRTEDPLSIISDIKKGIKKDNKIPYMIIENRRKAIRYGLSILKKDDILLIAGKGHEDYQILKDKTIHFSDKEEVLDYIENNK